MVNNPPEIIRKKSRLREKPTKGHSLIKFNQKI